MHNDPHQIRTDIQFLLAFVPATSINEVEPGLSSMFYITGKYEEDIKLIKQVQEIKNRYGIIRDVDFEELTE